MSGARSGGWGPQARSCGWRDGQQQVHIDLGGQGENRAFLLKDHGKPLGSVNHVSLATVLRTGCRGGGWKLGHINWAYCHNQLERMVAWVAVATAKATKSGQIMDILRRVSRGPCHRVNRQVNRYFKRKHTNSQAVPLQPFSQTLIMPGDNSAVTEGSLCRVASVSWLYFWMALHVTGLQGSCSSLFIAICFCLFAREATSVCAVSTISWQLGFVLWAHLGSLNIIVLFVLICFVWFFQRTKMLLGFNFHTSNAQSFQEHFNVYTCEMSTPDRIRIFL